MSPSPRLLHSVIPKPGGRFGRYELGPRLGRGGAADVYLARLGGPRNSGRLLALKIIHEQLLDDDDSVRLFLEEAHLAVRLAHPNIVHVYELGQDGDRLYIALEYLHGQTVAQLCSRAKERGLTIPSDIAAWIGARAAAGLHHAHTATHESGECMGLIHRDICPQNLFVTYDGQVKIIDFGIARSAGPTVTSRGIIRGRFRYMAPEMVLGRPIDHRVDLFALGATVYEIAMGKPAFSGSDEIEVLESVVLREVKCPKLSGLPDPFVTTLERALAIEPDGRHASADELGQALDACVEGSGQSDPRKRLVAMLDSLFSEERASQAAAITVLSTGESGDHEAVHPRSGPRPQGWQEAATTTQSLRPAPSRVGGWLRVLAVLVGVPLIALAAWWGARVVQSANASEVVIEVDARPNVPISVRAAGSSVANAARFTVRRGSAPVDIEVTAEGYQPVRFSVVPDRNERVIVTLVPQPSQ